MLKNFNGLDGFVWWVGVVEDRNDPLYLGRCKVRIFAWHTKNKSDMPTEELQWAIPSVPLGGSTEVVGPKESDWVWGFFMDSMAAQQPVMCGRLVGYPETNGTPELGFYDPRGDDELQESPRDPQNITLKEDGTGSELEEIESKSRYPDPRFFGESSLSRLARNENIEDTIIQQKRDNIAIGQTNIPKAIYENSGSGTDDGQVAALKDAGWIQKNIELDTEGGESENTWSELETPYDAKYPYNHVHQSESGHIIEIDDTPGKERLHTYHRSGSFIEHHPDGSKVEKIVNTNQKIVLESDLEHVENDKSLTVDKAYKILVNKDGEAGKDYTLQVGEGGDINVQTDQGNFNFHLKDGNWNIKVNGDINTLVTGDSNVRVGGNANIVIEKDANMTVQGNAITRVDKSAALSVGKDCSTTVWGNHTKYVHGDLFEVVLGKAIKIAVGGLTQTQPIPLPPTAIGSVPGYIPAFQEFIRSFKQQLEQQSAQSGNSSSGSDSTGSTGSLNPAPLINNLPKDNVGSHLQDSFVNAYGSGSVGGELLSGALSSLASPTAEKAIGFEWIPVSDRTGRNQTGHPVVIADTVGKGLATVAKIISESGEFIEEVQPQDQIEIQSDERQRFYLANPISHYVETYGTKLTVMIHYIEDGAERIDLPNIQITLQKYSVFNPVATAPAAAIRHGGGFLWKPKSDGGGAGYTGKLVVLTRQRSSAIMYRAEPDPENPGKWKKGEQLDVGKFSGNNHNGGRNHYRFKKFGWEYGPGPVFFDDYFIGDPSQRNE